MNILLSLFDLFIGTAKKIALYLPQSGSDLLRLFRQILGLVGSVNGWIAVHIGLNLLGILNYFGKWVVLAFNFFFQLAKNIAARW